MPPLYDDKSKGSTMIRENNGIFKATSKDLVDSKFEKLLQKKVKAKSILQEFNVLTRPLTKTRHGN